MNPGRLPFALEAGMAFDQTRPRGMYFEEFAQGLTVVTAGRTVTESDVVTFAGLSGDFNQIHVDAEYSAQGMFGQRVAHGLLCLSIASGLAVQTGVLEGTVLAFREINEWKFSRPVFLGDTLHVVIEVKETKSMPRLGGGLVTLVLDVKNQKNETVMKGTWATLMASKP
jgi:3-hydroxybutyryl-CoA dehydratase